jgi:hypothetical protein
MPEQIIHPQARVADLLGLLLTLENVFGGVADIYGLDEELEVDLDDLMPIVYAAASMGFVTVGDGVVAITDKGMDFLKGNIEKRKELLRESLKYVEPFKTAMELKSFTVNQLQEALEKKGFPDYSGPTGYYDLEIILTEWGVYSKLLKREGEVYKIV